MKACLLALPILCFTGAVQLSATTSKLNTAARTGPCILNDDGMKCTKTGFYETVQCDTRGCFCVAANNGFVAFDTRTSNNKTQPICSNCHNALKKLFADGDVPQGTFIPKCDISLGNYEPLQCDAKQEWCYCVDPATGNEHPNTRKRKEANKFISCGKTEYSIDPTSFPPQTSHSFKIAILWRKSSVNWIAIRATHVRQPDLQSGITSTTIPLRA